MANKRVLLPKLPKRKPTVLDEGKLRTLFDRARTTRLYPFLVLAAATGCRRGELLALQWPDLDFETGMLSVSKSLEQTRAGLRVKCTKSDEPRFLGVPEWALEVLKEDRAEQGRDRAMFGAGYADSELIFCQPGGQYYSPDRLGARVVELMRSVGLYCVSLHSLAPLTLLTERRGLDIHDEMFEEIRNNREKDYANAALRGQEMQLGFLRHSLMISRMHFCIEMACRKSAGKIQLEAWRQGGPLTGRKVEVPRVKSTREGSQHFWEESEETERLPVEPDALFTLRFLDRPEGTRIAHFFYEADRGSMNSTDMLKKFRAYHHFVKRQQRHKESFGIHPIRAVLVETTDESRARRLMQLVHHPLVCGSGKRAGLFWFTISSLYAESTSDAKSARPLPHHLVKPEVVFEAIWALPDQSMHSIKDIENAVS
jgi:hypothetical protein